jgi:hypothetical protein
MNVYILQKCRYSAVVIFFFCSYTNGCWRNLSQKTSFKLTSLSRSLKYVLKSKSKESKVFKLCLFIIWEYKNTSFESNDGVC